ncbi:MAG: hydroxyacid dehydrogenase [Brachymonas sp.]
MKIIITEFMDERAVAQLAAQHDVVYDPKLVDKPVELLAAAASCQAIIVRNRTQVRGELLAALKQCKVVGRLGVGLDNIDVPGCAAAGMQVIPATGANALSVAEYVIASTMLLLRGAFAATDDVATGRWPRNALSNGRETAGKTLGIIGFGGIGQLTGKLAKALGMNVIAYDPVMKADAPAFAQIGAKAASLDEVITTSDVVTLHVPLVDGTRGLFNAQRIASMKPGSILINTSRGHIVDVAAVADSLKSGHLGGAALDVFDTEPMPAEPMFEGCPGLILTPHISGVTYEGNERVSFMIADLVLKALK